MKRRILALAILLGMIISTLLPILVQSEIIYCQTQEIETYQQEELPLATIEKTTEPVVILPNETTTMSLLDQMNKEIAEITYDLRDRKQKKDWFIAYKNILAKYPKSIYEDMDFTIYDAFTSQELDLLFRVVEAEVGSYDFISKCNVASVIFNRLYSDEYETLSGVLYAKKQFSTITNGVYKKVIPSQETILACEFVFIFGDTTNGAYFFDSTDGKSWAAQEAKKENGSLKFLFRDDAGHDFYTHKKGEVLFE